MDWDAFERALAARRREILTGLTEWLRQDTVTQRPERVRAGAAWLAAVMRRQGLQARVLETGGNPLVYAERRAPGATRTVLVYCHLDTKPVPPAGWLQPSPLEPVLRPGLAEEEAPIVDAAAVPDDALPDHRLYARGASDDKGPIWAHLEALRLMDALGAPPRVDVKLVFEGEEETGSPNFGAFAAAHRDLLRADLALVTDGPKDASGAPTVVFGARGILALTLELETARRDVHSGNFSAPNAAWLLTGLLASMAAPDGTPLIEGLAADAAPPTAAERELLARMPIDREALGRELGVPIPADYLERLMFRPTLTIRGLRAGGVGEEGNTVIPHRAAVALDLRLVKHQTADTVYRRVLDHIRAQGFTVLESADAPLPDELRGRAVRVLERRGYDPAKTSPDLPISRRVIEIVERAHGGRPAVVVPTAGGSVPLCAFTDVLGVPTIVVPYANANNRQHAPNEHLRLDHLYQGIRTTARLLRELGE